MSATNLLLLSAGGPSPRPPVPPVILPKPTRAQICEVRHWFQGMSIPLPAGSTFDPLRAQYWFDPLIMEMGDKADRMAVYAEHRRLGNTDLNLSLDLGGLATLPGVLAVAKEAIEEGKLSGIILCCMGDGHTVPAGPQGGPIIPIVASGLAALGQRRAPRGSSAIIEDMMLLREGISYEESLPMRAQIRMDAHNSDPGALGYDWLYANFPAIYAMTQGVLVGDHRLSDHIIFVPGYDGCVPDWQPPSLVDQMMLMMRSVIDRGGSGYAGLWLSGGYCTWGNEEGVELNNWATPAGKAIDVVFQEGPIDMGPPIPVPPGSQDPRWTQVYQIGRRMVSPSYPVPGQTDDLHPPFLLGDSTPRGSRYYVFEETDAYSWTLPWRRGGAPYPFAKVLEHRQALRDMGCIWGVN